MKCTKAALVFVALASFGHVHATPPCKTFEDWIADGPTITSIECVVATANFTIPDEFASTLVNLENLKLRNLGLQGAMSSLTSLTKLTKLVLGSNALTGNVPDLAALSLLTYFDLSNNPTLTAGPIPNSFASMAALTHLNLQTTARTSTLPITLQSLAKLETLDLENNQLVGTIPESLGTLTDLYIFAVRSNLLTGRVPTTLVRPEIEVLHLGANQFSGYLSGHPFSESTTYMRLSVTGNRMYGPMPTFSTYLGGTADINTGDSLGDFIADGKTCTGREADCSSGASSCAGNGICCSAFYTSPNSRGTCTSGFCVAGTGQCVGAPTRAPNTIPSTIPTKGPTSRPSRSPTRSTTTAPTTRPTSGIVTKAPTGPEQVKGSSSLVPILSASGVAAAAVLGIVAMRRNTKRSGGAGGKRLSGDNSSGGDIGTNWLPNPKYVVMGGSLPGSSVGSTSYTTGSSSAGTMSWTSKFSSGVPNSFRGHVNDATSVAHIDI